MNVSPEQREALGRAGTHPVLIVDDLDDAAVLLLHGRRGQRPLRLRRLRSFFFKLLLRDQRKKISHPCSPHQYLVTRDKTRSWSVSTASYFLLHWQGMNEIVLMPAGTITRLFFVLLVTQITCAQDSPALNKPCFSLTVKATVTL